MSDTRKVARYRWRLVDLILWIGGFSLSSNSSGKIQSTVSGDVFRTNGLSWGSQISSKNSTIWRIHQWAIGIASLAGVLFGLWVIHKGGR